MSPGDYISICSSQDTVVFRDAPSLVHPRQSRDQSAQVTLDVSFVSLFRQIRATRLRAQMMFASKWTRYFEQPERVTAQAATAASLRL